MDCTKISIFSPRFEDFRVPASQQWKNKRTDTPHSLSCSPRDNMDSRMDIRSPTMNKKVASIDQRSSGLLFLNPLSTLGLSITMQKKARFMSTEHNESHNAFSFSKA
jgi:hypothetical protein